MCGIFALFLKRPLSEADIRLGRAGLAGLAHRGPDDSGEWIDAEAGVYIGHRRLAIIDPTPASAQPLKRNNHVIVYNGAIYNFPALREELVGKGISFSSKGDTEVLLRAWQTWDEAVFDRLDGMFAFVVWDGHAAHLAVDPFGEKPLYWAETPDGVYVASELGPLAEQLGLRPLISRDLLNAFLAFGYFPAPSTAFPQIKRLPRATTLAVHDARPGPFRRYWVPPMVERRRGHVEPLSERDLDAIAAALTESLARRFVSDVPMALFLSAGIDSSLVAALAKRELSTDLECLTVSFSRGRVVDEAPRALRIGKHLGLRHRVIDSEYDANETSAEMLVNLYGEPSGNIGIFPIYQIARAARRYYKVALTGMGGDEITWGYNKHYHFFKFRHLYAVPERLRLLLGDQVRWLSGFSRAVDVFMKRASVEDAALYLANKNFPAFGWLNAVPGFAQWAGTAFAGGEYPVELAVPLYERDEVMPNAHLVSLDRGSMRASLELRTPFLNRDVVETIARFDPRALIAFGQKSVLRRLLSRYIPKEFVDYPKSGFTFPADVFVELYGDAQPAIPGLPNDMIAEAWRRRYEANGWLTIAIRMIALDNFFHRYHNVSIEV